MINKRWIMALGAVLLALPAAAFAQQLSLDMGEGGGSATARMIQIVALITMLSIAPSLLLMVTSFTRIIIVLSFVRTALGTATTPPNQVLIALSMFLTFFIMAPTFKTSYEEGILPLVEERISEEEAMKKAAEPFHKFMLFHAREKDLNLFMSISKTKVEKPEMTPYEVLIPAFMISELRRAFEIGFLIFIPFLIIDLLVASILMAMGMMMLPPVVISLPFKLIFFVLVDGWYMVAGSLVRSFGGL
ncbi:MAG: flagellar type III secretion system pore protein FliP [Alphaproteobacteria bacterium]|nr:flagellar type III secretion system pore protein FliP [Alphaproteobacteria bacterium]